jgi:Mycothiol maleylpyruvate isomerase N-terminal domain
MTAGTEQPLAGATFAEACAAVEDVLPRFTEVLRSNPGVTATAVGSWTLPEVACHVSHVIEKDTDALKGRPLPSVELSPVAVAAATNSMLDDDPERDLLVLADRIDALGARFLELRANPPSDAISWIGGTPLPPHAVACHLLEELLVHGYDVAKAARTRWRITRPHAALAIVGAAVPIMSASPQSWVRPSADPQLRARVEFRLRGHERFVLALDNGLHVEMPPARSGADAYLSADPAELLLVMLGRHSRSHALARGKVIAWGRRPQALRTLMGSLSPP